MVSIRNIFLNLILCVLSYIVPKNKKQVLLGADRGLKFFGNPKYLYLFLLKNKTYFKNVFWITVDKKFYSILKERRLPVLYLYSLNGFIAILRSNYLIVTHFTKDVSYSFFLPGRFNKIQTWHGTPLKQILEFTHEKETLITKFGDYLERKERNSYKLVLTASEETKKIFDGHGHYKNAEILGYPRNDVFFNHSLIFDDSEKELNLNQYGKIILYCPTFRDIPTKKIPFTNTFLNNLNNYLTKNNYLFLIKGHYWERSNVNIQNHSNIIDVSEIVDDVQELLIHTDVLITDYSSVFVDFMLLDKPIILYAYDLDEYLLNCRRMYYDYYNELPGPFALNEEQLLEFIKSIDSVYGQTGYKEKYDKFKNRFNYYKDGKSSERLCNRLLKGF